MQALGFTPIAHAYVQDIWFVCQKMQHNVVLGQIIVQNSTMMYYINNVYECLPTSHDFAQSDKLCSPFYIWPPLS
jgi:hypothetical protein